MKVSKKNSSKKWWRLNHVCALPKLSTDMVWSPTKCFTSSWKKQPENRLRLARRRLRNEIFQLVKQMCFPLGSSSFQRQRVWHLLWVFFSFFRCWDVLASICLSQSCLQGCFLPSIIPLCCSSPENNCDKSYEWDQPLGVNPQQPRGRKAFVSCVLYGILYKEE